MKLFTLTCLTMCAIPALVMGMDDVAPDDDAEVPLLEELLMEEEEAESIDLSGWDDPAFDRYVDFQLLSDSLANDDAAGVADVALQLAEAERVLYRTHAMIDSEAMLASAMTMAMNNGDDETLGRLKKFAEATNNEELTAQLESASLLASESRAAIPPAQIDVNTDPEVVARAQDLADAIELAENTGDRATLNELRADVAIGEFPENLNGWLTQLLDQADESVGEEADENAEALTLLVGSSRGWYKNLTGNSTPRPIQSIAPNGLSIRPRSSESSLLPVPVYGQGRPDSRQQMRNNGYRKYNDVKVNQNGQVQIGGRYVGQAQKKYNPRTKQHFYDFRTKKGGRIVQQSNGQTWVKPGQRRQQSNFQMQNQNQFQQRRPGGGGKHLGTVPNFWNR